MKKVLALIAAGIMVLLGFIAVPASATNSPKVEICHATASETNPYTSNNVNTSSVDEQNNQYLNGHGDHEDDIIPAFSYGTTVYPGQNLTAENLAILANGCNIVVPTAPPTTAPPTTTPPTTEPPTTEPPATTAPPTTTPPTTRPPGTPGQQTATPTVTPSETPSETPVATVDETPVPVVNTPGDSATPVSTDGELPSTGFPATRAIALALLLLIGGAAISTLTKARSH